MRRTRSRLAKIAAFVLLVYGLSFFFEPRKTTFSCKSISSCLGFGTRHNYVHEFPKGETTAEETGLKDGSVRFDRKVTALRPSLLFLVLTKDATSWSKDFRSQQRNAYDFLDMIVSTQVNLAGASLAVLTSSLDEYDRLVELATKMPFARVSVIYRAPDVLDDDDEIPYNRRHDPKVQLQRRSFIAALRNYLMYRGLEDEEHIVWVDADVVEFSPRLIQTMITHSSTNSAAGIITARCQQNQMDNYDKNAWKVNSPQLLGPIPDGNRDAAVQKLVSERLMVPDLLKGTNHEEIVPLDSVGGTVLYIRAKLVRKGVVFPTFNVVGTEWGQAGWIGVETEGICYLAKSLVGGGCYVLGGGHFVRHSDLG